MVRKWALGYEADSLDPPALSFDWPESVGADSALLGLDGDFLDFLA
jgi:hypothetical protein